VKSKCSSWFPNRLFLTTYGKREDCLRLFRIQVKVEHDVFDRLPTPCRQCSPYR
jgi:hypothetical protein